MRKFYAQLTSLQKKKFRKGVEQIMKKRKEQIQDFDRMMCEPLRYSIQSAQRALKSEIPIEQYIWVEEATQKHLKKVLGVLKVKK